MTTPMRGRVSDGTANLYRDARLDLATHSLVVIDYDHHKINASSSFTCHWSNTETGSGDRSAITFKTPDSTKWGHFVAAVHATQVATARIYEAVAIVTGAAGEPAALSIFNRNRNSSATSGFISQHTTPVTGGASAWTEAKLQDADIAGDDTDWEIGSALEIERHALGGGSNPTVTIGGSSRGSQEIILKQNTVYMVMITCGDANANTHSINLDWYDHTDKD